VISDETSSLFLAVLREYCADSDGSHDGVEAAVNRAAAEARDCGMRAEQFVIWVKRAWDQIMDEGRLAHSMDPARTRDVVISSAIKAYYVQ
jgi:hypothetical protein